MNRKKYLSLINISLEETKEDYLLIALGVLIIISSIVLSIFELGPYLVYVSIFLVALRIIILFYVMHRAELLHRNVIGWSIFAFIAPSFAAIIIGLFDFHFAKDEIRDTVSQIRASYHKELQNTTLSEEVQNITSNYRQKLKEELTKTLDILGITPKTPYEGQKTEKIGSFFVFLFSLGTKKFGNILTEENRKRNTLIGHSFLLLTVFTCIVFLIVLIRINGRF